jgi:hypothetical protein
MQLRDDIRLLLDGWELTLTIGSTTSLNEGVETENGEVGILGTCNKCDKLMTEEHRHSGHGAPEVGWTYIQCDECGHQTHISTYE